MAFVQFEDMFPSAQVHQNFNLLLCHITSLFFGYNVESSKNMPVTLIVKFFKIRSGNFEENVIKDFCPMWGVRKFLKKF